MPFTEPRPRHEDIPTNTEPADVLLELRQLSWEWRKWRYDVNGDLGFLSQFRDLVQTTVRAVLIAVPVLGLALAAYVALR